MRFGTSLFLAAWTLAACSPGSDETRGPGSRTERSMADPDTSAVPAAVQSDPVRQGTVEMTVFARVAGSLYRTAGQGECASSTDASIYEVPATLWQAALESRGTEPSLTNLTIWQPKAGGGDMVGLSITVGETTHEITTVKGGRQVGSGVPEVRLNGPRGMLTVTGKDNHGDAIELQVQCGRFDEVVAEGG
jgi:hypothetical protein